MLTKRFCGCGSQGRDHLVCSSSPRRIQLWCCDSLEPRLAAAKIVIYFKTPSLHSEKKGVKCFESIQVALNERWLRYQPCLLCSASRILKSDPILQPLFNLHRRLIFMHTIQAIEQTIEALSRLRTYLRDESDLSRKHSFLHDIWPPYSIFGSKSRYELCVYARDIVSACLA